MALWILAYTELKSEPVEDWFPNAPYLFAAIEEAQQSDNPRIREIARKAKDNLFFVRAKMEWDEKLKHLRQ